MSTARQEPARHYVTLKAAVWKGDRLLLVHEDTGESDLPGGRIERDESIEQGLRREIREELGVEIAQLSPLPTKVWATRNADGVGVVGILYEAELASLRFEHTGEVVGASFLGYEELLAARGGVHKPFIVEYFRDRRGP
jgi:ADP-ribose pyrophosphatase YjhB (NUDIX family)